MAVNPAGEAAFRIIQVHPAQVFKAHHAVKLGKGGGGCLFATQIVTGGKRVTGINTDANAGFIFNPIDDRR